MNASIQKIVYNWDNPLNPQKLLVCNGNHSMNVITFQKPHQS